jgi:hypothetical protein
VSITDVQRAFLRGLNGRASCKAATIDFESGGREQRLSFHVLSSSHGAAYLSEVIPADMCPMQHARHMATEFLEGRIGGQSRMAAPPAASFVAPALAPSVVQSPALAAPVASYAAPVPNLPAVIHATPVPAPVPEKARAPQVVPAPVPATGPAVPDADKLDALIASGDLPSVIDVICQWIDADAGTIRAVWYNDHPGQALEYEQVRREINDLAYKLVDPSPSAFPCLWASVGVDVPYTGDDAADIRRAAAVINDCIDATSEFLAMVRSARLRAKAAVRVASSIENALAVYEGIEWPVA